MGLPTDTPEPAADIGFSCDDIEGILASGNAFNWCVFSSLFCMGANLLFLATLAMDEQLIS